MYFSARAPCFLLEFLSISSGQLTHIFTGQNIQSKERLTDHETPISRQRPPFAARLPLQLRGSEAAAFVISDFAGIRVNSSLSVFLLLYS